MSSPTTKHDDDREAREVEVSIARLPVTGRALFGRAADLAWLDACWEERAHVASVVAWGGVGKSALVNAWLAAVRDEGWRGAQRVFGWSFYSQGTDRLGSSDEFFAEALRWFGDEEAAPRSPWDKGERLARLVRRERALLILDGVEPLQWGPGVQAGRFKDPALEALVKELGAQNKGLCVITSRIGLTDLEGLGGDKVRAKDLGHLSPEAGAELLKARGAKGADEELRAAAEEYDGHSLALTLLGTYVRKAHKGDIRQREDIPPLEGEPARRMMATYERWFAGKPELAILRMLGLFDRPAPVDEITALRALPVVLGLTDRLYVEDKKRWYQFLSEPPTQPLPEGMWNEAVTALRDVGLLAEGAEADDRLDAHPLVREHFGEQLRREQPEAWREGHRRLYEHLKAKARPLPETIEEMAPLYAAVVHGCLAGKSQEALGEVWSKRVYRQDKAFNAKKLGAVGSEVAVYSAFFDPPWERLAPGLTKRWQAWVVNAAGWALQALGRLAEAAGLMRLGLEQCIAQENWKDAATGASNLSELLQSRGELGDALAQARRSVELADKGGDAFWRAVSRTTLAAVLHAMGLREEAATQFEEAEQMQKGRSTTYPLLSSLPGFRYCDFLLDQGRDADVRERVAQTLEWVVRANLDILSIALDHLSLGRAHLLAVQAGAAGDLTVATSHLAHAVDGLRRAGAQHHLPLGLLARAALHTHTGAFDLARRDLDEAHTLATRCGFRLHLADAHLGLARLSLAEGHPSLPAAREHLTAARSIIDATGYHRRDAELTTLDAEAAEMTKTAPPPPPPVPAPSPAPTLAKPIPDPTPSAQPVDLGIIVALPEELRAFLDLTGSYAPHPAADLDSYLFTRGGYRCAVTLVGEMGETQAGMFTERLISALDPAVVLSLGIAGGVHDDLRAGDVHVPSQAAQYLQDAKAAPTEAGGFGVVPGAPAYRADFALLKALRGFEFAHRAAHAQWVADCGADLAQLLPDVAQRDGLVADKLVRREVKLLADGHVATGPVVGAAPAFPAWIRTHDRHVKSLEMESAAVLLAAQTRSQPKRALAIRGISDKGDDCKKALDDLEDGVLRRYAMRNAVRLLWALLDAGALPRNPR